MTGINFEQRPVAGAGFSSLKREPPSRGKSDRAGGVGDGQPSPSDRTTAGGLLVAAAAGRRPAQRGVRPAHTPPPGVGTAFTQGRASPRRDKRNPQLRPARPGTADHREAAGRAPPLARRHSNRPPARTHPSPPHEEAARRQAGPQDPARRAAARACAGAGRAGASGRLAPPRSAWREGGGSFAPFPQRSLRWGGWGDVSAGCGGTPGPGPEGRAEAAGQPVGRRWAGRPPGPRPRDRPQGRAAEMASVRGGGRPGSPGTSAPRFWLLPTVVLRERPRAAKQSLLAI